MFLSFAVKNEEVVSLSKKRTKQFLSVQMNLRVKSSLLSYSLPLFLSFLSIIFGCVGEKAEVKEDHLA